MDDKSVAVATVVAAVDQARSRKTFAGSAEPHGVDSTIATVPPAPPTEQVVWSFSDVVTHPTL